MLARNVTVAARSVAPVGTTPVKADARPVGDFIDSIGVNVHTTYDDTAYRDPTAILDALDYLGVRHVRDGLVPGREAIQLNFLQQLAQRAGCADLVLANVAQAGALAQNLATAVKAGSVVSSLEGPNEYDISDVSNARQIGRDLQGRLAELAGQDPATSKTPIVGPSFGRLNGLDLLSGQGGAFDLANIHPYAGSGPPESAIDTNLEAVRQTAPDKPVVITEDGYHNAESQAAAGVTRDVAASYLPRALLYAFAQGVVRTYVYELVDEGSDPNDPQKSYGLMDASWQPKPAAVVLARWLRLLAAGATDAGGLGGEPSALGISLGGDGAAQVDSVLMAKGDGRFALALWDPSAAVEGGSADQTGLSVTVHLADAADITSYLPAVSDSPQIRRAQSTSFDLTVGAQPVLIDIDTLT